jgi:hypothetical protein
MLLIREVSGSRVIADEEELPQKIAHGEFGGGRSKTTFGRAICSASFDVRTSWACFSFRESFFKM